MMNVWDEVTSKERNLGMLGGFIGYFGNSHGEIDTNNR